jgi:hypothetical protein
VSAAKKTEGGRQKTEAAAAKRPFRIQAPVAVSLEIGITDSKDSGTVKVTAFRGEFPSEAQMAEMLARFRTNPDELPPGWRLMTKREWWNWFCDESLGQRFAMPGGEDFDP